MNAPHVPAILSTSKPFGDFSRFAVQTFRTRFGETAYFLFDAERGAFEGQFKSDAAARAHADVVVAREMAARDALNGAITWGEAQDAIGDTLPDDAFFTFLDLPKNADPEDAINADEVRVYIEGSDPTNGRKATFSIERDAAAGGVVAREVRS